MTAVYPICLSPFGHTYYGSGNLPGSVNQGILGILFLNPTLQEHSQQSQLVSEPGLSYHVWMSCESDRFGTAVSGHEDPRRPARYLNQAAVRP